MFNKIINRIKSRFSKMEDEYVCYEIISDYSYDLDFDYINYFCEENEWEDMKMIINAMNC